MEHLKKVIISKRAELAAKGGHPWIYGTEIEHADEGIEAGDIVRVESKKGKFVGSGFTIRTRRSPSAFFRRMRMIPSTQPSGSGAQCMRWITACR